MRPPEGRPRGRRSHSSRVKEGATPRRVSNLSVPGEFGLAHPEISRCCLIFSSMTTRREKKSQDSAVPACLKTSAHFGFCRFAPGDEDIFSWDFWRIIYSGPPGLLLSLCVDWRTTFPFGERGGWADSQVWHSWGV